jgi:hypothetical protein
MRKVQVQVLAPYNTALFHSGTIRRQQVQVQVQVPAPYNTALFVSIRLFPPYYRTQKHQFQVFPIALFFSSYTPTFL